MASSIFSASVFQAVASARSDAIGLAVIITNDYYNCPKPPGLRQLSGTHVDGNALSKAFTDLNFVVCWIKNAVVNSLQEVVADLRRHEIFDIVRHYRCILFIFSGHGYKGDYLYMQDGTMLQVDRDIINPFLPKNLMELGAVQKAFLIDACRGQQLTDVTYVPRGFESESGSMVVAQEGGYVKAFSTLPEHMALENRHGGLWLSILAKHLGDPRLCSLSTLLIDVNEEIANTKCFQQPEWSSRQRKAICLNPRCSNPRCPTKDQTKFFTGYATGSDDSMHQGTSESDVSLRPRTKPEDPHQQGQFRKQLNHYFQTKVISGQPAYNTEMTADGGYVATVQVVLTATSEIIEGRGAPDKAKAATKESAAQVVCGKIESQSSHHEGVPLAIAPSASKKKLSKPPKTRLKEYVDTKRLTGKGVIQYETVDENGGFRSTVRCAQEQIEATGEVCLNKQDAEHSAAEIALKKLHLW